MNSFEINISKQQFKINVRFFGKRWFLNSHENFFIIYRSWLTMSKVFENNETLGIVSTPDGLSQIKISIGSDFSAGNILLQNFGIRIDSLAPGTYPGFVFFFFFFDSLRSRTRDMAIFPKTVFYRWKCSPIFTGRNLVKLYLSWFRSSA